MQKLTADDPESKSADLIAENIERLQELFPEAFTEGRIDFEVLKQLLGSSVDEREEKYGLNWHGKRRARQMALTPSAGTLRPCPEESVDWDTTQNLMIEGDNLEVLKLLQKSYAGKVKLIYIDPPYNTGKDFVYPDNFQDSIRNYLEITGQSDGEGQRVTSNAETSGRFHTDWLNMMYPRIKLARQLLSDDGLLCISLDDAEVSNMKCLCCEVFGEENFVSTVIWQKKYARQNDSRTLSTSHDYIVLFAKSIQSWKPGELDRDETQLKGYRNPDNDPRGRWQSVVYTCNKTRAERPNLYYPIKHPATGRDVYPDESRVWAYEQSRTEKNIVEGRLWWGSSEELEKPRLKSFLSEVGTGIVPDTLWFREDVGDTQDAAREIARLMGGPVFGTPKPVSLIKKCIKVANCVGNDIVLDFFAGSGTTGDAVYAFNREHDVSLRYILVQLPELLDSQNREQQVADQFCKSLTRPSTIAEVTKERLRRCAVVQPDELPLASLDRGFRVFKLNESNIRTWEPSRDDLSGSLLNAMEHIRPDRTEQDILFELLLKLGLELTVPIESQSIAAKTVHSIGAGTLLVCLDPKIGRKDAEPLALGIVEWWQQLAPTEEDMQARETRVIFRDSAFEDDVTKTNLTEILKQHGLANVRSL